MSAPMLLATTLSAWFAAFGLWIYFFWVYRDYRLDAFRQKLFAVRDELFDYAAQGNISFDHPSYRTLRQHLNGMLRFAHRLTIGWIIGISIARLLRSEREVDDRLARQHERIFANAPSSSRADLARLHEHAMLLAIEHLLLTSLIFWLAVVPIVVVFVIRTMWRGGAVILGKYFP